MKYFILQQCVDKHFYFSDGEWYVQYVLFDFFTTHKQLYVVTSLNNIHDIDIRLLWKNHGIVERHF